MQIESFAFIYNMFFSKIINEDIQEIIDYCTQELLLDKLKNKSILITGATGMVDSNIRKNPLVNILLQDVAQEINVQGDVDYIIHAASPASPKIINKYPVETNFANTIIVDAIKAMLLVLLKSKDIVYNVGDENSKTTIKELAEILVNINIEEGFKRTIKYWEEYEI